MNRHEELTGVFDWEKHVFQDSDPEARTIIGTLADDTVVKGRARRGALECGLTYRFLGHWTTHPRFGKQFAFSSFSPAMPAGERATVKYLTKGPGIGSARAQRIWNLFRERSLEVVRTEPERIAAEIEGMTPERAEAAAEYFRAHERLEKLTIEVNDLLSGKGFPRSLPDRVIREWGEDAPRIIREQVWPLMRFTGVGFLRTDALYLELGHDPAAIERQAYAVWHAMATDGNGHTWFPVTLAALVLNQTISNGRADADRAIAHGVDHGVLVHANRRGGGWLAEPGKADAESRLAECIHHTERESAAESRRWPAVADEQCLTPHQIEHAARAMAGHLGILAGSPGTGKTYTLARIIQAIGRERGGARIAVCAPTGKAAVRATESLAAAGVPCVATTIHRLLGVVQAEGDGDRDTGWRFDHDEDNPLHLDFLFVDEASMVDTSLLASLLAARPIGCHVMLIGDPNQLAPVGHGAPLRDLIAAGVSCGHLAEIRRNAGRIVRACAEIRERRRFQPSPELRLDAEPPENLVLCEQSEPAKQIAELESWFPRLTAIDPVWDVQVVVPVNDKSPLARKALNKHLQRLLNPQGETVEGCPFRVGDKVVCLKNSYLPLIQGERNGAPNVTECYVANGEQACVTEVSAACLVATLDSPARTIRISRGRRQSTEGDGETPSTATGCDFDLAYAVSVHKSQGSEWPVVIVMLDSYGGARRVMTREWLYTAVSRAKTLCVVIGAKHVADAACRRSGLWQRKTFLREEVETLRGRLLAEAWTEDLSFDL